MKAIDKLILGTVQFGLDYGISNTKGKPTKDKIFEMIFNPSVANEGSSGLSPRR
jgi:hypothetical protein